ncbi:ABC transporter ATP-binding protein [Elizabethkingia anophelis]|uniref:ABC transporter ATP-binding protein n=1 Tax=Elizabethkingia anophelis TaxID=1117645 RepID=UPI000531C70F|nr:ABC transporter ATP-binding protein [Elizabethkingia anophelis]AQW95513.1 hypothetical protein BBD30_15680 [Elizabethkingia anophelis]KGT08328.1 hypothetical protein NV63_16420 [Elizabethkingia anophelis]MCL1688686.1 ABC transporter ATP-binding protein [Elizabethkingia anophelis]MDV3566846.1 ABC transporter ATP-binding protein [Elizabethkingia anophelis]MDV3575427.1 ABC transporter ATP-binding protein [Elizabethkingia anophelis]
MKKIISVEHISYQIGNKNILNNVNLTINYGDSFALIGQNGAGKTSLFEIILKDIKPSKGNIFFDSATGDNFKNVGIVYDQIPLFPLLKVREIIDYFSTLYGINKSSIPPKNFNVFGIEEIMESYVKSLSQGEKKKLGLFLSIINNPILLILDEPFSNIDPTAIDGIWQTLKENNRTILFTTHNWKEAESISNRIAFIYKGEIIMEPKSSKEIIDSLPYSKMIITDFNEDLINKIRGFDFYVNDKLLYIFNKNDSNLTEIISRSTNNFSFKESDIKDAYLFKIKGNEEFSYTV